MAGTVKKDGRNYRSVTEGLATILTLESGCDPSQADNKATHRDTAQPVFYNPIQQFNRDLSVLAIRVFADDFQYIRENTCKGKSSRYKNEKPVSGAEDGTKDLEAEAPSQNQGGRKRKSDVLRDDIGEQTPSMSKPNGCKQEQTPPQPQLSGLPQIREEQDSSARTQLRILDALSATGLRALRYAKEIPTVKSVTANDLSVKATDAIKVNVEYNNIVGKIDVVTGDAVSHMYDSSGRGGHRSAKYDVIDLDPYGTAAPFLDGAIHALSDGGLLCVTCTDSGVWASTGYSEKAFALYGGTPIKGLHSHEGGLRLILHSIAMTAARYGMTMEPLLSLSIDFYIRVFVRIRQSSAEVKLLAGKTMLVYSCDQGCGSWQLQYLGRNQPFQAKDGAQLYKHSLAQGPTSGQFCEHCGFKTHISGPMFAGPLHNTAFIERIVALSQSSSKRAYGTLDRIEGMLTTALEESVVEDSEDPISNAVSPMPGRPVPSNPPALVDRHPFYFVPSALAKVLHCAAPSDAAMRGALRHAGYKASRSHANAGTIKTNAPWPFIWSVMREWAHRRAPIKEGVIKQGSAGWKIWYGDAGGPVEASASTTEAIKGRNESIENTSRHSGHGEDHRNGTLERETLEVPTQIVFDEELGRQRDKKHLVRYQFNPTANWGPMQRAKS